MPNFACDQQARNTRTRAERRSHRTGRVHLVLLIRLEAEEHDNVWQKDHERVHDDGRSHQLLLARPAAIANHVAVSKLRCHSGTAPPVCHIYISPVSIALMASCQMSTAFRMPRNARSG